RRCVDLSKHPLKVLCLYVVRSPNGSNRGVFLPPPVKNDRQF
ncbi:unnamed protein product, partial [Amoebophrya sp. A120]